MSPGAAAAAAASMAGAGTGAGAGTRAGRGLQMTLGLIKPTVCSYQPDVSAVLKRVKALSSPRSRAPPPPQQQQQGDGDWMDLVVVRQKRLFWKTDEAEAFYAEHKGRFYYDRLIAGMTSGPCMALALAGPNAVADWRTLLGPTKAYRAKWEQPDCLRAMYGLGDTRNGFHGSGSVEEAKHELGLVFEGFAVDAWLAFEEARRLESSTTSSTARLGESGGGGG